MKIRNSAQKHSKEKQGGWVGEVGKRHKMMTWRVPYNHNFYLLLCNGLAQVLKISSTEGSASSIFKVAWGLQKSK